MIKHCIVYFKNNINNYFYGYNIIKFQDYKLLNIYMRYI